MAAVPIMVSIAGEDLKPADYNLQVLGLEAKSGAELQESFWRVNQAERKQYRSKVGLWKYVLGLIRPRRQKAILIYPEFERVTVPDGRSLDMEKDFLTEGEVTYSVP